MKQLINKILKKLIKLKETQPDILQDINQLHKQSKKIKKVEYLESLGIYYENKKEYPEALKMYIQALEITDTLKNMKKSDELLTKIKENYSKSKNIMVYLDELHKFIEELKIIVRVNGEMSEISKQILNELEKIHKVSVVKEKQK